VSGRSRVVSGSNGSGAFSMSSRARSKTSGSKSDFASMRSTCTGARVSARRRTGRGGPTVVCEAAAEVEVADEREDDGKHEDDEAPGDEAAVRTA
jgi:hypothetical protein